MGDYNEIWFANTRVQTRNIKRWFLWGIILFIFVTIGTSLAVKSMYKSIRTYEIQTDIFSVKIDDAKSTKTNGYIKGSIQNQSEEDITGKYIKFTFYNEKNEDIGREYIEVGSIRPQQIKTYEVKFRYPNVEKFIVTVSDSEN